MSKKTHQTSREMKPALLSDGFAWQKSMKQAPQQRVTPSTSAAGGKSRMLPDSHLYNTEKPYVQKPQTKLNRCAIHFRQSKYFLIVSVHVNEVLHRANFYREEKPT